MYENVDLPKKIKSIVCVFLGIILFHVQLSFPSSTQIHFLLFIVLFFSIDSVCPSIGPFYAFLIGLCLDLITAKTLGMCAGVYAITNYLAIVFRSSFLSGDLIRRLAILSVLISVFCLIYSWEMHLLYHSKMSSTIFNDIFINLLLCVFGFAIFGKLTTKSYNRAINE